MPPQRLLVHPSRNVSPPVVFGFRRGRLRHWGWLGWVLVAGALGLLGEGLGVIVGVFLLLARLRDWPPRYGALVYSADTPCLWLDTQRVVLGGPYRVIYRDELSSADFARLRRLCRGLPT